SLRAIARCLSRSPSTISREIRRNSEPDNDYQAERAQASRLKHRRFCRPKRKLSIGSERFRLVEYLLRRYLSPEQIAGKLRHMNLPKLEDAYVCRETIYTAIYA
ncbi:helix-turn-helix domain-containing protein, partial [Cobetia marina]